MDNCGCYETLFSTAHGRVYKFTPDLLFQVDFGNIIMPLKPLNLASLYQFLQGTRSHELADLKIKPSNKIIIQPAGFLGCYGLTEMEFIEFRELITGAFSIHQMEKEIEQTLNNNQHE